MELTGLVCLGGLVYVLCIMSGSEGHDRCQCPVASTTHYFPANFSNQTCCLNFSGSSFPYVPWVAFGSAPHLQILDLSFCNLTLVQDAGSSPAPLRKVYLSQNQLRFLPPEFLADAVGLELLDLGKNLLEKLPDRFLINAGNLKVLILSENRLKSLPVSVLKLPLLRMDLWRNPWMCSCSLVEEVHAAGQGNFSRLKESLDNLTCFSPERLSGRVLPSVQLHEVCRLSGLNALFILLPLLVLALLTLFWCCRRNKEKKDSQRFGMVPSKNGDASNESMKENTLKNQLTFRRSSAFLGSTRDMYEQVEVKLWSVDTLGPPPFTLYAKEENQDMESKQDLETVSVSEVMKDSADREKAYMIQSTKYYSLVPGLEIYDSDHCEYENVELA